MHTLRPLPGRQETVCVFWVSLVFEAESALCTHCKWCSLPRMASLCPPAQEATEPSLQTRGDLRLPGPALQPLNIYFKNRVPIPSRVARENQALLPWWSCPLSAVASPRRLWLISKALVIIDKATQTYLELKKTPIFN